MSSFARKAPNPKYQLQHWEHNYGKIPSDWSFVTIGSLFVERTVKSNNRNEYPLHSLTIERGITPKTERYERGFLLKDEEGNEFSLVETGDFVFNPMNLRFGAIAYSRIPFPVLVSAYYNVIIPNTNRIDPDFMEAMLRSYEVMDLYERIAIGSLLEKRRIHLSILNETYIPLPTKGEQREIGKILASISRAIDLTERLIVAKQECRIGLMQQLLTGKRRLPGFNKHWKEVCIGDFLKESRIPGSHGKSAKKITVKLYGLGVLPKTEAREGSENTKYYTRKAGQFIYSKLDFLNGAFGIIPEGLDGYESTLDLPCFDFQEGLEPKFLLNLVCRDAFYSRFLGSALGGRKARRVNPPEFLAIRIRLPELEEQMAIVRALDLADLEINLLRSQFDALQDQKKGLMQQLLTGKVRVKV